jgi:hypothetical protein
MLASRLENELLGLKTIDGQPASMLIDKRLPSVEDVRGYAEMAKASGRKFVLFDVDAPLEHSLAGVLERVPGGADPLPPFKIVADGFEAVRDNRGSVVELFKVLKVGSYHLYGTLPDGRRIEIATIERGMLEITDKELYEQTTAPAERALASTRISSDSISELTKNFPPERAAKIRGILQKYEGWTWKAALDAHSREKSR